MIDISAEINYMDLFMNILGVYLNFNICKFYNVINNLCRFLDNNEFEGPLPFSIGKLKYLTILYSYISKLLKYV